MEYYFIIIDVYKLFFFSKYYLAVRFRVGGDIMDRRKKN